MFKKFIPFVLKITIAIILIQTLRFKFLAHADSVYIFQKVGLERFGRIGIGVLELIAAILILIKRTSWIGAILVIGILTVAIFMHLTQLGVAINYEGRIGGSDHGTLFYTAVFTCVLAIIVLWMERKNTPFIGEKRRK